MIPTLRHTEKSIQGELRPKCKNKTLKAIGEKKWEYFIIIFYGEKIFKQDTKIANHKGRVLQIRLY